MTPFWSFIIGAASIGFLLSIIFGALVLDAEEEAYRQGFEDGLGCTEVENDLD